MNLTKPAQRSYQILKSGIQKRTKYNCDDVFISAIKDTLRRISVGAISNAKQETGIGKLIFSELKSKTLKTLVN